MKRHLMTAMAVFAGAGALWGAPVQNAARVREIAAMYQIKDYIVKRIIANGKRDYLKMWEKEDGNNVRFKKYRK